MAAPLQKKFKIKDVSAWDVFSVLCQKKTTAFFLDSHDHVPPNQRYSHIGFDPFLEVSLRGKNLTVISGKEKKVYPSRHFFQVMRRLMKKYDKLFSGRAPYSAGIYGFLGYECVRLFEKIKFRAKGPSFSEDAWLGFFNRLLIYDHKTGIFTAVVQPLTASKKAEREAQSLLDDLVCEAKNVMRFESESLKFAAGKVRGEMTKTQFKDHVNRAKEYIAAGDIYQANLSQKFGFRYEGEGTTLYSRLRQINPSPFSSFFKVRGLEIVSSSPERLVKKEGAQVETRPIAGTCRKEKSADIARWKKELLQNDKERAEHLMLVDLERNDLGRVCDFKSVKVEEFMVLEKYSHVVHIVSKVIGKLSQEKDAWDLIQAVFPGGTITGCPKIRCMEIIDELEGLKRSLYTGSLGRIDFNGDMDLNIIIRTILLRKGKGTFQVGAGIVYDSDPEREYEETLHKAEALISALSGE